MCALFQIQDDETGIWTTHYSDRSPPNPHRADWTISGVLIHSEGVSKLQDVHFSDFTANDFRRAAAISFFDGYRFHNGARTASEGLTFDNVDTNILHENLAEEGPGEVSLMIRDLDGSLTNRTDRVVTVARKNAYYSRHAQCETVSNWNLDICETNFSSVFLFSVGNDSFRTFLTQDSTGEKFDPQMTLEKRMVYYVDSNRPNDAHVVHFDGEIQERFEIYVSGLEK